MAHAAGQCRKTPVTLLVLGMAGSGKTTFVQQCVSHLQSQSQKGKCPAYVMNLDPAVMHMPYDAHIDIRDTVNYKKLMSEYKLGPNGGLMTAVNLFATQFDQVIDICEKRFNPNPNGNGSKEGQHLKQEEEQQEQQLPPDQKDAASTSDGGMGSDFDYIIVDTPGQMEVFTWSASGQIIAESLASVFPTVVCFVVDATRCAGDPKAFVTNMVQACSVLYKFRLPTVMVFNKCDIVRGEFAEDWLRDLDALQSAISEDGTYAADLARSLALVMEDFYVSLPAAKVSSRTGSGFDAFFEEKVVAAAKDYEENYWVDLQQRRRDANASGATTSLQNLSVAGEPNATTK